MKKLSKFKQLNPLPNDLDDIKKYGFNGDIGTASKWITDGHAIFWRSGFDVSLLVNESTYSGKKPKPDSIAKLWDEAQARQDVGVAILGSLDREYSDLELYDECDAIAPVERAILRDELDRIIYADAFKLSFVLYALKPDALSVAKEDGNIKLIRFSRNGELVGCLMPMRSGGPHPVFLAEGYDLDGDALPLEIKIEILTEA